MTTPRRWHFLSWLAAALLGLMFATPQATAQPAEVMPGLHAGAAAAALAEALAPRAGAGWRIAPDGLAAACAAQGADGATVRFALVAGGVSRLRAAGCGRDAAAEVLVLTLGHEALVLATPAGHPPTRIEPAALFRAFAANAPRGATPASLLAPVIGDTTDLLFDSVMEAGCVATLPFAAVPSAAAERKRFCGTLRDGGNVARRRRGPAAQLPDASAADAIAQLRGWAAAAAPGAVAAMSLAEWLALAGSFTPLPLEGMLPTVANLSAGHYPAARRLDLAVVRPHAAGMRARTAALDLGFALIGEAMVGPTGALAGRGMATQPASYRVDARTRLAAFLEARR